MTILGSTFSGGKSVDTKCSITGNIGGLIWKHNSTKLDTSNAAKYIYTPGSATLTIMNADFSDSGTYVCEANNVECLADSIAVIPGMLPVMYDYTCMRMLLPYKLPNYTLITYVHFYGIA